jgi:hypothetical protein
MEVMFGPTGLIVMALLIVACLLIFTRARSGPRRTRGDNVIDMDLPDQEHEADQSQPSDYPDFTSLLERFVLPLHKAHPGWERLDGAYGVPGRPVAWFYWDGTRYGLNGETHFAPLLKAREWLTNHPSEDALIIQKTTRGAGRLTFRPEIGLQDPMSVRIETG